MTLCISVHSVTKHSHLGSQEPSMFVGNTVVGIGAASVLRDLNLCSKGAIMKSNANPKQCLWYLSQVNHSHSCGGRNLGSPQWYVHENLVVSVRSHRWKTQSHKQIYYFSGSLLRS